MKIAEWILRSHREHLATEKLLEAKLQQVLDISEEEKDDYIEAQMLKHAQIDGCHGLRVRKAGQNEWRSPIWLICGLNARIKKQGCAANCKRHDITCSSMMR